MIKDISQAEIDLLVYKLYQGTAIWFSGRVDCGHSVTVDKGRTYKFEKGEMLKWANEWMRKARKIWLNLSESQQAQLTTCRQPGVRDAITSLCGENDTATMNVPIAGLPPEIDCLCPDCTDKAIRAAHKRTEKLYSSLVFPGKDISPGVIQYDDTDEQDATEAHAAR